jgi:hypothetical protein
MLKAIFLLLFLGIFAITTFAQSEISSAKTEMPPDFISDNCTFFPEGRYSDCCVEHDKAYYFGGSYSARRRADNKLFGCVAKKRGFYPKLIAPIMWAGVRVFGTSVLPTDFRWGFGKNKPKNKKKKKKEKSQETKSKNE